MKESIWQTTVTRQKHKINIKNRAIDVAVIGGGMTGILTAYLLKEHGYDVEVFEENTVGSGMTANTTAKITSQHSLIYDTLLTQFGYDKALEYASRNEQAIAQYEKIIMRERMECDFKKESAYVYTTKDITRIKREVEAAKRLGINAFFTKETALPFEVNGAVCFQNQAQFHPLKFLCELANGIMINENSKVLSMKKNLLDIAYDAGFEKQMYHVQARFIVIATHYPFINHPGYFFLRMHQERSYVIAVEQQEGLDHGMYIGECQKDFSFRRYKEYILIGGENHRTGCGGEGGHYKALIEAAKKYYSDAKIVAKWSNQDCMTTDQIPYIGRLSKNNPNVFVATGYNKWGMSSSMVAAMMISKAITGHSIENSVFSPRRFSYKASKKKLKSHVKMTVKRLGVQKIYLPKGTLANLKQGEGKVIWYRGRRVGAYMDEDHTIYAISTKCPHLGCMLSWNPEEKTWDCPCHGSRFDYKGNCISNPSLKDGTVPKAIE